MKPEPKRPVTLDDLLRLKRAERPPAGFWAEFDRTLRAKQLAALVAKRPWWQTLPSPFAVLRRHRLPIGAAAAFALTLVAMREYRAVAPAKLNGDGAVSVGAVRVASQLPPIESAPAIPVAGALTTSAEASPSEAPKANLDAGGQSRALAATLAVAAPGDHVAADIAPAVSQASVSLSRAAHIPDFVVADRMAVAAPAFEPRPATAQRAVIDPLQQMTPPGESRRAARLLTAMVSSGQPQPSSRVTERAASRIAEDSLYEQVSRFGARGDRFNVKF